MVSTRYLRSTALSIKQFPHIDWGLHVDIGENTDHSARSIEEKAERQLHIFTETFGINPSHVDFHKGFRFTNKVYFALRMFALKNNISFRYDNHHSVETRFYGAVKTDMKPENINVEALVRILVSLPAGVTELVCHPGWTNNRLTDPYRHQRALEISTLFNSVIRKTLKTQHIRLISYKQYQLLPSNVIFSHNEWTRCCNRHSFF